MITEEDKYRAYTFNFIGFAVITPFGRIVLENVKSFHELGLVWFLINLFGSICLLIWGLTLVEQRRSILDKPRRFKDDIK
ncbi:MAG: hypothetical protein HY094_08085 [Candidatus Melainabacteria bacterium]|nr:hypothetical protein [Candidatus Melainabacteria bacterium]